MERTTLFLMANLGSEVSRLLSAIERGDAEMTESCKDRSLKIIDQVVEFPEMKKREVETSILREVIDGLATQDSKSKVKSEDLRNYFNHFGIRFMNSRAVSK